MEPRCFRCGNARHQYGCAKQVLDLSVANICCRKGSGTTKCSSFGGGLGLRVCADHHEPRLGLAYPEVMVSAEEWQVHGCTA